MHENISANEPNSFFCLGLMDWVWGGAMVPFTNSVFGSALLVSANAISSSGPQIRGFWILLFSLAAFLSTARYWPRDGALFLWFLASGFLLLELRQNNREMKLNLFSLLILRTSVLAPLSDLLDSSTMLETPIRLPSVVLLSGKKDPVDWIEEI